jgi:iron(III) transport system substrate-binding protein
MTHRLRPAGTVASLLTAGLVLAACGSAPTDTPAAGGGGDGADAAACEDGNSPQEAYAAVEGQTGDERYETLLALAKEESAPFGYYHSGTFTAEIEAFQEKTGLEVGDFEATSERVMERARAEQEAGRVNSAVILGGDEDMQALYAAGGLADLETTARELVGEEQQAEAWVSPVVIMMMPAYNTKAVNPADAPETWEEFFTEFDGRVGIEITDWKWYAALVQQYFMEQQGMTEEEAIALITQGLQGAQTVDGHTLTASLLASEQYDYVPNVFAHYIPGLQEEGAPVTYDNLSPDMPPVYLQLGVGLTEGTCQAASGLLFLEFLMSSEGQEIIASRDYVAPATSYEGESLLEQYPNAMPGEPVARDGQSPAEANQEWIAKYDELLRAIGGSEPISK